MLILKITCNGPVGFKPILLKGQLCVFVILKWDLKEEDGVKF